MKIAVIGSNQLSIYRALYFASRRHSVSFYCHSKTRDLIRLLQGNSALFNNLWNKNSLNIEFQDTVESILDTDIAFLHYTAIEANYHNKDETIRLAPAEQLTELLTELSSKVAEAGREPYPIVSSIDIGIGGDQVIQYNYMPNIAWLYLPMLISPECSYSEYNMYMQKTLRVGCYLDEFADMVSDTDPENSYCPKEEAIDSMLKVNSEAFNMVSSLLHSVIGTSYTKTELYKKAYDILYISKANALNLISRLSLDVRANCKELLQDLNRNVDISSLSLPVYHNLPLEMVSRIRPIQLNILGQKARIDIDFDSTAIQEANNLTSGSLTIQENGSRIAQSVIDTEFFASQEEINILIIGVRSNTGGLDYRGSLGYCSCLAMKELDNDKIKSIKVYDRYIPVWTIPSLEGIVNSDKGLIGAIKEANVIVVCNRDYNLIDLPWKMIKESGPKVIYDIVYAIDNTQFSGKDYDITLVQI